MTLEADSKQDRLIIVYLLGTVGSWHLQSSPFAHWLLFNRLLFWIDVKMAPELTLHSVNNPFLECDWAA